MKKLISYLLTCLMSLALICPNSVNASESDEHEFIFDSIDMDVNYEIQENKVIEYVSFYDSENNYIEFTREVVVTDVAYNAIQMNNELLESYETNVDYDLILEVALKSLVPTPFCNLSSSDYTHYYQGSDAYTFTKPETLKQIEGTVATVLTFLNLKFPNHPAVVLANYAKAIYDVISKAHPDHYRLIINLYKVNTKSTNVFKGFCYHTNQILYDEDGNIMQGGGMKYYQPW